MNNILENTAAVLGMNTDEIMHQLRVMHIAADRCVGNIDKLSGYGRINFAYANFEHGKFVYYDGLEISYGEKLDFYFQYFLVGKMGFNARLAKAFIHTCWWDQHFTHPRYEDILAEVHYQ